MCEPLEYNQVHVFLVSVSVTEIKSTMSLVYY
jgi:hypothetical protein